MRLHPLQGKSPLRVEAANKLSDLCRSGCRQATDRKEKKKNLSCVRRFCLIAALFFLPFTKPSPPYHFGFRLWCLAQGGVVKLSGGGDFPE